MLNVKSLADNRIVLNLGESQQFKVFFLASQNEIHVHDLEHKKRASQETGAESQRKKVKVIDIRHSSAELHHDSKSLGELNWKEIIRKGPVKHHPRIPSEELAFRSFQ